MLAMQIISTCILGLFMLILIGAGTMDGEPGEFMIGLFIVACLIPVIVTIWLK